MNGADKGDHSEWFIRASLTEFNGLALKCRRLGVQKIIIEGLHDSLLSLPPDYNVTTALTFLQPPTEMAHKHITQKYDVTATEMWEYMVNYDNMTFLAPKALPLSSLAALNQET